MQYVSFGNTPMRISRLCLGGMMLSRKLDLDQSRRVVDEALDNGVNFIDTAESYGDSEEYLGKILAGRRDKVHLATKVYTQRAQGDAGGRNGRQNILFSLERSLRLLQTDYIDLYQLHHPDDQTPMEETLAALDEIVRQGKARYVGVTNHYAWQTARMIAEARRLAYVPIFSVQCSYSIVDRPIEIETVPMAQNYNLAIMAYYPLRAGVLSGKYKRDQPIPPDARAAQDPKLQRLLAQEKLWTLLPKLQAIAERNQLKLNQLAMLWLLARDYITCPIIGGSALEHYRDMYAIADRALPESDVNEIDAASLDFVYKPFVNQPVGAMPGLAEPW
jgi:aryl-alcohol dehydrogenase-like predicted oxidoreductase